MMKMVVLILSVAIGCALNNESPDLQTRDPSLSDAKSKLGSEQIKLIDSDQAPVSRDSEEEDESGESGEPHQEGESDESHQEGEASSHQETETESSHHYLHPGQLKFWINALIATVLTCIGGFCSGMTVGLMSIQTIQLEIMSLSKDQEEKKVAKRILSVIHDHHLFLVTLLLANAMALQTLPLIVHSLMPDWMAIIFSTIIVLVVGQIVPQAYCTGPKKIQLAYYASPIILTMIKVLWILAYPMAKGLDSLLGKHEHQRIQHKDFANFLTGGSQVLKPTQKMLLTSILELRTQRVPDIMVGIQNVYMLSLRDKLTPSKISEINKTDYSYILVYKNSDRDKVAGVIKTKQFALEYLKRCQKDKNKEKQTYTVQQFFKESHSILSVYEDTNLLEMLMLFQAKSDRFALVIGKKKKVEAGIKSIMYSKRDMIAQKEEGEIQGVVFLYQIFEEVAEYNEQVVAKTASLLNKSAEGTELKQLQRPLISK